MAARVDKAAFPTLVAKMWDRVLKPEHLIGGFRAAGLHPLSQAAIPATKLKTSVPFRSCSSPQPSQSRSQPPPNVSETPVSIHIAQFFGNLFVQENTHVVVGRKGRTLPTHYGEPLTEEEVVERIHEQDRQKKDKATKKRQKTKKGQAAQQKQQPRCPQTP